ncbi:putative two-component response regulator-like APRR7 isoform [Sesbania bispinosa]|nr:putative two-component response regulator-like APRR7 isoform [Sesbania bispinosa]
MIIPCYNDTTYVAILLTRALEDSATQDFHCHYENYNCISNNIQHQLVEGNIGNYSVKRSTSGSNNGSNGQNGSSTTINDNLFSCHNMVPK